MSYNLLTLQDKPTDGICSDASYLKTKNLLRWRVVSIANSVEVDRKEYLNSKTPYLTNIGEFLGLIAALKYRDSLAMEIAEGVFNLAEVRTQYPVYSDSKVAIGWVRGMYVTSHLLSEDKLLWAEVVDGLAYLKHFPLSQLNLHHWNTPAHGEIPSDFNMKPKRKIK